MIAYGKIDILALVLVAVAALLLIRQVFRMLRGQGGGCGCCTKRDLCSPAEPDSPAEDAASVESDSSDARESR
jgi:hypothetical protein